MELEFESQRPLVRAMPHVEMVGFGVARNQDLVSPLMSWQMATD